MTMALATVSETAGKQPPPAATNKPSFYRRPLPESCVALSSKRGRRYFESALQTRGLKSFFALMEQHSTQSEPAYCGISTLVIALNALAIDPRQTWKGPWRWYTEHMLNCCMDLEKVKETGITMKIFDCLATCQGLQTAVHHADDRGVTLETLRQAVRQACVEEEEDASVEDNDDGEDESEKDESPRDILVVSYCRKQLGQTGSGHFSPIAAYDEASDSVLILDTARFKYGVHWVKLTDLFEAMKPVDKDTSKSRGFILLSKQSAVEGVSTGGPQLSVLLQSQMKQNPVRRQFKEYLANLEQEPVTLEQVVSFWTRDGADPWFVWNMTSPQLRPSDKEHDSLQLIKEVRKLLHDLMEPHTSLLPASPLRCYTNHCRALPIRPAEVVYLVYLACLEEEVRNQAVSNIADDASERARQQLLAEAELIRYAIEISDQTDETA